MSVPRVSYLRPFRQIRHYSARMDDSIPPSKQKYIPKSGTYPHGFKVSGTHVGVKASNKTAPDLALIISDRPCAAAAVFTKNICQAAPVTVSKEVLGSSGGEGICGIIINSGCANAVTGRGGLEDAKRMSRTVDSLIAAARSQPTKDEDASPETLVMSTGVIGQRLPIEKIISGIPAGIQQLSNEHNSWLSAARAICTTDTFPKLMSTTFSLPSSPLTQYRLAGMTKGAGMIHPNMATLLGILCTDAPLPSSTLQTCLMAAVEESFNAISIDGDTSTNDTVALLANGTCSNPPSDADTAAFQETLTTFSQQLSQLVVRDGEGATKFVRIRVINPGVPRGSSAVGSTAELARKDARLIAASIARSPLVKTALYGNDANWGRILCAIGYTQGLSHGEAVILEQTSVSFVQHVDSTTSSLPLLVRGEPQQVDEARATAMLKDTDLEILVDLGGRAQVEASYWTCDLSHEYVTINGDYRT